MNKSRLACLALLAIPAICTPALAQTKTDPTGFNAKYRGVGDFDHVRDQWYEAPREIQIIDERPVVRDFRPAPAQPKPVGLPKGPIPPGAEWRSLPRGATTTPDGRPILDMREVPPRIWGQSPAPFQGATPPLIPAKDGHLPADAGDYSMPPKFAKPSPPIRMKPTIQVPSHPNATQKGVLLKRAQ